MSDKLKIIQEPVARQSMLAGAVNQQSEERLFYTVETCSSHTYYIEVPAGYGSLQAAISRLSSEFNVDAGRYCTGCEVPAIQSIAIVSESDVPEPDDILVFVSRLQ